MTPQQRRQVRDILSPRIQALEAAGATGWLVEQAKIYFADHTLSDSWWGLCVLLIRAERLYGLRTRTAPINVEASSLLQEIRIAIGGNPTDPEFMEPVSRPT